MKLDYEIETNKRVDRNGEEIIETDTILYEADDREIYKIGLLHLPSIEQQEKMLSAWDNEFSDERKAQAVVETMRFFGDEVYDHFRQTALDSAFAPTSGESGKVDKSIEEKPKAPHSANGEVETVLSPQEALNKFSDDDWGEMTASEKLSYQLGEWREEIRAERGEELATELTMPAIKEVCEDHLAENRGNCWGCRFFDQQHEQCFIEREIARTAAPCRWDIKGLLARFHKFD